MDFTKDEIALRALRMIGVCAGDEPASADQSEAALSVLQGLWAEVLDEAEATWDVATGTPPAAAMPLVNLLAAELAPEFGVAAPMSRARAKLRLLAVIRGKAPRPDDLREFRDYGARTCR